MANEGTVSNPLPSDTNKVEPKVWWGAVGAYIVGAIGALLVEIFTANENQLLLEALPDVAEAFILPFVPAIASLVFAYQARHQYRSPEIRSARDVR